MDNTRRTLLGLIFLMLIALLVGAIWQLLWNTERLETNSAESTRTTLDQTIVAVTMTADTILTTTNVITTPTPVSVRSNYDLLLNLANEWPLLTYEPFDNNHRGWSIGGNGIYSRGERKIENGIYRWQLTAIEGFTWWTTPINVPYDNFYTTVTVDKAESNLGAMSIIFRYVDGDNYYDFGLCDDVTQYRVYKKQNGSSAPIIACTTHPAIHSAESNYLAILAQTDNYLFFINDQHVATVDNDELAGSGLGIGLDMNEGQANVFEFDDMVVRSADIDP